MEDSIEIVNIPARRTLEEHNAEINRELAIFPRPLKDSFSGRVESLQCRERFNSIGMEGFEEEDTQRYTEPSGYTYSRHELASSHFKLRRSPYGRVHNILRREYGREHPLKRNCRQLNEFFGRVTSTNARRYNDTPAVNMEQCVQYDGLSEHDRDRIFHGFFECVEKRAKHVGDDIFNTMFNNRNTYRRFLHDTIDYDVKRDGNFTSMVDKLIDRMGTTTCGAIFFHEDSDDGYQYYISRGYNPTYDYCVFRNEECLSGHKVWELEEECEEEIIHGRRKGLNFRQAIYYPTYKKIHSDQSEYVSIRRLWSEPIKGHFHTVHACKWYNQECRCFSRHFNINPRKNSIMRSDQLDEEHIRNIMFYNTKWPRWAIYYKMSLNEEFRFIYRTESVRIEKLRPIQSNELAGSSSQIEIRCERDELGSEDGEQHIRASNSKNSRSSQKGDSVQKILTYIQQIPTWPIGSVTVTNTWLNSPFKTWLKTDKTIKRAIEIWKHQLMNMKYSDLLNYYQNPNTTPIWSALGLNEDFDSYYYPLDESIEVIEKLLDFQVPYTEELSTLTLNEAKKIFITDLWDVLEKNKPKQNTFEIISDPGAGKNYLIDLIQSFYLNTGIIGNFNRHTSFPLMEAVGRRINYWNEPNFEPAAIDTLKKLLGGDPLTVSVKYQDDGYIPRTPVITTGNKRVFPNNEAFHQRIKSYYWAPAPWLKDFTRKPHPMTWKYLVDTYVLDIYNM